MPLIICPQCKHEVSSSPDACAWCGHRIAKVAATTDDHDARRILILMILILVSALALLAGWRLRLSSRGKQGQVATASAARP